MSDDDDSPSSSGEDRWTCEACGCNTNEEDSPQCSVCGTSRQSEYLAPFAVNLVCPELTQNLPFGRIRYGFGAPHCPFLSRTGAISFLRRSTFGGRSAAASRSFSTRPPQPPSSSEEGSAPSSQSPEAIENASKLLSAAKERADPYSPIWSPTHAGEGIHISSLPDPAESPGVISAQKVAVLVDGASDEGCCVRSPLPLPVGSGCVGWQILFNHPSRDAGRSMGGCYLVGVTTEAFTSFSERSGLQQSRAFWGIEDGGRVYEGRRHQGRQLSRAEAPRNPEEVLFGSGDLLTVVADIDNRSLTYWRNGLLVGTLVTSLPRGALYPIAVPFNSGVTCVISGLHESPPKIRTDFFARKKVDRELQRQHRKKELTDQKELLILPIGGITPALKQTLTALFSWYGESPLSPTATARLWYRCGFRLSKLSELSLHPPNSVSLEKFLSVIDTMVLEEEEKEASSNSKSGDAENPSSDPMDDDTPPNPSSSSITSSADFQVGDKVELSEDYRSYGDAISGPLRPFDRASVIEIQTGVRSGEPQVRVSFNSRKWWYNPNALRSERGGMIESASVMLIKDILRAHGFKPDLSEIWGQPVTKASWRPGDWVFSPSSTTPTSSNSSAPKKKSTTKLISRVVADGSRSRDSGYIAIETIDGIKRHRANQEEFELTHTTFHHGVLGASTEPESSPSPEPEPEAPAVNGDLANKVRLVSKLDSNTIYQVIKEISTSMSTLASYFSCGLPKAINNGLKIACSTSLSIPESSVSAISKLALAVVRQLYSEESATVPLAPPPPVRASTFPITRSTATSQLLAPPTLSNAFADFIMDGLNESSGSGETTRREALHRLLNSPALDDQTRMQAMLETYAAARAQNLLRNRSVPASGDNNNGSNTGVIQNSSRSLNSRGIESLQRHTTLQTSNWREIRHMLRSASSKRVTGATLLLIHNGLMLDSPQWVKRALTAGADAKSQDEDRYSVIRVAILLGCSCKVISMLISAGAIIGPKELEAAATSNQPDTLSLLLSHTVYEVGSFNADHCSDEVKAILKRSCEEQDNLKTKMILEASDFMSQLLETLLNTALSLRLNHKISESRAVTHVLVGDSIYYVVADGISSLSNKTPPSSSSSSTAQSSAPPQPLTRMLYTDSSSNPTAANLPIHPLRCLLALLPKQVLEKMEESTVTTYMRLVESYMWCKDVGGATLGLNLANLILSRVPELGTELDRYGTLELARSQVAYANATRFTSTKRKGDSRKNKKSFLNEDTTNISMDDNEDSLVMECNQGHRCSLHLTKHSSFRCDLCGRGVELGKPMHGCRKCDWDACESCTDKAEGGALKWKYAKLLLKEVDDKMHKSEAMFKSASSSKAPAPEDYLHEMAVNLSKRDLNTLEALAEMLKTPGRITAHEMSMYLLPSIHAAITSESSTPPAPSPRAPMRKKPRMASSSFDKPKLSSDLNLCNRRTFIQRIIDLCFADQTPSTDKPSIGDGSGADPTIDVVSTSDGTFEVGDRVMLKQQYLDARGTPSGPMAVDDVGAVVDISADRVFVEFQGQLWHYLKTSLTLIKREGAEALASRSKVSRCPEILRMLHTILAFEEQVTINSNNSPEFSDLQSLLVPFQVRLRRALDSAVVESDKPSYNVRMKIGSSASASKTKSSQSQLGSDALQKRVPSKACSDLRCQVHVEPLMPMTELQHYVLRTSRIKLTKYIRFCRKLALDRAIIAERPLLGWKEENKEKPNLMSKIGFDPLEGGGIAWDNRKVARVIAYDESTGTHVVRYASHVRSGQENSSLLEDEFGRICDVLDFNGGEARLVMASRDYFILYREGDEGGEDNDGSEEDHDPNADSADSVSHATSRSATLSPSRPPTETSAQVNAVSDEFDLLLPVGTRVESDIAEDGNNDSWRVYTIVSGFVTSVEAAAEESDEEGELKKLCKYNIVSETGEFFSNVPQKRLRGRDLSLQQQRLREQAVGNSSGISLRRTGSSDASKPTGVIKRQWSALTDAQHVRPMELAGENEPGEINDIAGRRPRAMSVGGIELGLNLSNVERPPKLSVHVSLHESLPPVAIDDTDMTLFHALQRLKEREGRSIGGGCTKGHLNRTCDMFYNVMLEDPEEEIDVDDCGRSKVRGGDFENATLEFAGNRSLSSIDGLNQTCQNCIEVIHCLAEVLEKQLNSTDDPNSKDKSRVFVSKALTTKLIEQLEDPLAVVSGALPEWCRIVPIVAPALFTHEARRMLLERGTFGVSRAVFRQQETKVDVAGLRSRMEAIRQRAIALMQEAFSEDAEDPMALQLQADELYSLEENIKAQVASAFKKQRWAEHWLQSAKGHVRRSQLLNDANLIMTSYASNASARRRRLEIHFIGESGFDASSGESAGVTRGFYADVAGEMVSLVEVEQAAAAIIDQEEKAELKVKEMEQKPSKLTDKFTGLTQQQKKLGFMLWIPDVDPSGSVVIPTPRARMNSVPGLFPRPTHPSNPMHKRVLQQFRMLGRLFASALRDGFLVPLPLSLEFISLIQQAPVTESTPGSRDGEDIEAMSISSSSNEEMPDLGYEVGEDEDMILTAEDLPRPGFLGGEIYAMEIFICNPIREIDADQTLGAEERKKRKQALVKDKNFTRTAMGLSFNCSFEDYVTSRTFVDPFDVTQYDGFELCVGGKDLSVTVDNVVEYVRLCKRWILHDGILAQAKAFRSGVNDFFPARALSLLTPAELRKDICGNDSVEDWDEERIRGLFKLDGGKGAVEAMMTVAAIGGEGGVSLSRRFSNESPTFGFLVRALKEASIQQRRHFLSFVTSLPIVTPGPIECAPIVSSGGDFLSVSDKNLPRANTCARKLYLPRFESFEQFTGVFYKIIAMEGVHKSFSEWSGP